ncbi:ABC transporter permease [Cryobacterium levicorallinum]|uniref:ABC transporter permease n=1 Tax=Cryobacterium levicorallinum TaxID=995038 RepID=A0A1I3BYE7_9MICO|nr:MULTISPECIES: ABC transporter permease [Cryobacterium]TFB85666.1 ABC transporter permease [Cryobacterium levicorallinum]GEP27247.1 ABC transporter permease [Cryobacterium levicorallinum]SFH67335.1 peptide/nickel transport system permease protein [Cryobacterium levicorallinum]
MSDLEVQAELAVRSSQSFRPRRLGVAEGVAGLLALLLLIAAVAPQFLAPGDPLVIDPLAAFSPPTFAHGFGTDESGRDIYTRVVHGTQYSLVIGIAATAIGLGLGVMLGTLAGMLGPIVDFTVNRVLEVLFAFPGLLLALLFILVFGPGVATATIAVGLSTAPGYARIIRAQLIAVRGAAFVEAATVLGRTRWQILVRHILPNTLAPLFVLATLGVGQAIVWAATLSYLGLGAEPPTAEWGAMLSAGRTYITSAWWMSFFPGLFIVLTAVTATVLGRSIDRRMRHA